MFDFISPDGIRKSISIDPYELFREDIVPDVGRPIYDGCVKSYVATETGIELYPENLVTLPMLSLTDEDIRSRVMQLIFASILDVPRASLSPELTLMHTLNLLDLNLKHLLCNEADFSRIQWPSLFVLNDVAPGTVIGIADPEFVGYISKWNGFVGLLRQESYGVCRTILPALD